MQKLLYVPLIDKVGANEQWDLLNAFRSRFHTVAFDYLASEDVHRDMLSLLTAFNPDIVHMQLQDTRVFDPSKLANMKKSWWPNFIPPQKNTDQRKLLTCRMI